MEKTINVRSWGNSAGVLLPREWIGREVKVILIDRTLEIKKEIFSILEPYLYDIIGIYLVGSYARGEQDKDSDIDIIAISNNIKKEIISGKYNLSITPLKAIKKTLEENAILILPRLNEAKTILNSFLLDELKNIKTKKPIFKNFKEECERIIKINKGFIKIDKEQKFKHLDSSSIIYSLILRLRGVFLIKIITNHEKDSKKDFLKWIENEIGEDESEKVYNIYRAIKDNKKVKEKVKIETAEKLLKLLEEEVKKIK